jgi:hypothetical protein
MISSIISYWYYQYPLGSMMDMQVLMWVWFLVFGMIKLGNINAFVDMFAHYDLLSKHIRPYGQIYPFLEIMLWILYLRDMQMRYSLPMNTLTAIITGITSLGIIYRLYQGSTIKCACMWHKMTTPLWRPSLIEQAGMCAMALWMIGMMI